MITLKISKISDMIKCNLHLSIILVSLVLLPGLCSSQEPWLDDTFSDDGMVIMNGENDASYVWDIALQPDGKILTAGSGRIHRFHPDGTPDESFGTDGVGFSNYSYFNNTAIALQDDGKIITAGYDNNLYDYMLARFNADGELDTSFGDAGILIEQVGTIDKCNGLILQPDSTIIIAGSSDSKLSMLRFNNDGTLDTTFGEDGKVVASFEDQIVNIQDAVLLDDGKIILAGSIWVEGVLHFLLSRFNADGTLDESFATGGYTTTGFESEYYQAFDVAIQTDEKLIIAGYIGFSNRDFGMVRYYPDGSIDTEFGDDGVVITDGFGEEDQINEITIQPDGKIIAAGYCKNGFYTEFAAAKYNIDGSLDNTFGEAGILTTEFGGYGDQAYSVELQPDGKIITGGSTYSATETGNDLVMARYDPSTGVGVENNFLKDITFIYPNPTDGNLIFDINSELFNLPVAIYNITGSLIYREIINCNEKCQLDVSHILPGTYFISVESNPASLKLQFIKQ